MIMLEFWYLAFIFQFRAPFQLSPFYTILSVRYSRLVGKNNEVQTKFATNAFYRYCKNLAINYIPSYHIKSCDLVVNSRLQYI